MLTRFDSHKIINASIATLALFVVALAGKQAWDAYEANTVARQVEHVNGMTDELMQASSLEAVERGLTSAALGAPGPIGPSLRRQLEEARADGDAAWKEALIHAGDIAALIPASADFRRAINDASDSFAALERMRRKVDAGLEAGAPDVNREEWFDVITAFIADMAGLREAAFTSVFSGYEVARLNVIVKQGIWLAAEYAGLERGTLAYFISGRKPVPDDALDLLKSYRGVVDRNVSNIIAMKRFPQTAPAVTAAIGEMESNFLGRFEETRAGVYAHSGDGEYGMSGEEWMQTATGAIDSIFGVMAAVSRVIEEKVRQSRQQSMYALMLNLGLLGIALSAAAYSITRVMKTANALFQEKEIAEVTLQSIGDAVITTDASLNVEYLNPVAEELTGWTLSEARGRPLNQVFSVINSVTREPETNPAEKCLREQRVIGMDSNNLLIARDGREVAVEDSAAPVRDREGNIVGAVMVFFDVTKTRNISHLLSYQATHDALTGLVNRREFERRLAELLEGARSQDKQHALCYLDLDLFKIVNDTCGHAAGDKLLRMISRLLKNHVRDTDMLARLGGDEFGILMESCPLDRARRIADDLCRAVKAFQFVWENKTFETGVSVGLVPITRVSVSPAEILSEADAACYAAKDKGRNRVQVFQPEDVELARRQGEMHWVSRINKALEENRFQLYYQTIMPLTPGDDPGLCCEWLLRLVEENGEIVYPMAFIPAAERYNLMPAIDRWVVRNALATITNHRHRLAPKTPASSCAINLSGASLTDDDFLPYVREQFALHRVAPQSVCFEITETAVVANLDQAVTFMDDLRSLGCKFALDDFGSGMSSFIYLKHLPVNYLKITGSIVRNIVDSPMDETMVDAINRIGHAMGIRTIAESVETSAILERLKKMGVDFGQGYAISMPQPMKGCC